MSIPANLLSTVILNAPALPERFPLQHETTPENLANLHQDPNLQNFLQEIRTHAHSARSKSMPEISFDVWRVFEDTGDRILDEVYAQRRKHLIVQALDVLLHNAPIQTLENLIWDTCEEYSWASTAHYFHHSGRDERHIVDLVAAETAVLLAEISSVLKDRLDCRIIHRIRQSVEERVFQPIFGDPSPFSFETMPNNWSAVCAGSVGIAAMILVEDRKQLFHMLNRLLKSIDVFLSAFATDGGCEEGPAYWMYGFGYLLAFAEALKTFTGGALDLLDSPLIQQVALFPSRTQIDNEVMLPFSDSPAQVTFQSGIISRMVEAMHLEDWPHVPRPTLLTDDHTSRWLNISRNVFWTKSSILQKPVGSLFHAFEDLQWVLHRTSTPKGMLAFAARGGHNGESHNHNDLGHFVVYAGEWLLTDLGPGVYNKQYFAEGRYQVLETRSSGHSVPLVNHHEQKEGQAFRSKVQELHLDTQQVVFTLDLTQGYAVPELQHFQRTLRWDLKETGASLQVMDQFEPKVHVEEVFISEVKPFVEKGCVVWRGQKAEMRLPLTKGQWKVEIDALNTHTVAYRTTIRPAKTQIDSQLKFEFNVRFLK